MDLDTQLHPIPTQELAQLIELLLALATEARGGRSPGQAKARRLGPMLCELARDYRAMVETEGKSTLLAEQRMRLEKVRDRSAELHGIFGELDEDTETWLWRAIDEINEPKTERRRSRQGEPAKAGMFRVSEIRQAISELATASAFAVGLLDAAPGAKGGPDRTAKIADVRLQAAGEIGCIYEWLTGKKPTRQVRKVFRKGVKGEEMSVEVGQWRDFLAVMLKAIFGTSRGVDGYALKVAAGMHKNPQQYWTSLIHK